MNTIIKFFTVFCMALIISCGPQERNTETSEADNDATVDAVMSDNENLQEDTDFLVSAHINSQLQVALGQAATQQSQSPRVQEFGAQLVNENEVVQHNISALAEGAGIEIDPALTPEYASLVDSVQTLSGREFDEAFLDLVIEEHDEDIDRFTRLTSRAENPIVRNMISDNLEILRRRKNQAEELKDNLN